MGYYDHLSIKEQREIIKERMIRDAIRLGLTKREACSYVNKLLKLSLSKQKG